MQEIKLCHNKSNGTVYAVWGLFRKNVDPAEIPMWTLLGCPPVDIDLGFQMFIEHNTVLVDNIPVASFYSEASWEYISKYSGWK